MKSIILAAGFSTRLYPITQNFPKALLPVHGKEIIGYMLDDLVRQSTIDEIVLVTNKRYYPIFQTWINANPDYQHIEVIHDGSEHKDTRLGAIGDLQFVLDKKGWDDDILVLPSDTLFSVRFSEFISFFNTHQKFASIVRDCGDKEMIRNTLGCAEVEGEKLISFEEKPAEPKSSYLSVPVYLYPQHTLPLIKQYLEEGNNPDSPGAILPWLLEREACVAFPIENGFSHDIGTLEAYNEISQDTQILKFYQQ